VDDEPVGDVQLRDELLRRRDTDQRARRAGEPLFEKAVDGVVRSADISPEEQDVLNHVGEVDRANTRWLHDIVQRYGWPARSLVGEDGIAAAWLLVQHADRDPAFQRECLDLMRASPDEETSPAHIAYLTDRVLLAEGDSQIYGTQMTVINGEYQPRNLRDPETVNQRREAAGLNTIGEYLQQMRNGRP